MILVFTFGCKSPPTKTGQTLVDLAAFLRVTPGMTRQEVAGMLGGLGDHYFTYPKGEDTYHLVRFSVSDRSDNMFGVPFFVLFENSKVKSIFHSLPRWEVVLVPYGTSFVSRPKPWGIEDESYIREVLRSHSLSTSAISAIVDGFPAPKRRSPPNVLPKDAVDAILAKDNVEQVRRDYEKNDALRRRFDGLRIRLGMRKSVVDAVFGQRGKSIETGSRKTLTIYGDDISLRVHPLFRFSNVAVVYVDGAVSRVYSRAFICREWLTSTGKDERCTDPTDPTDVPMYRPQQREMYRPRYDCEERRRSAAGM